MSNDSARNDELIKYAHLAQHLIILGDNIDKLSEEIYKLESTLAFIRISGAPHSILNIADLKAMLSRLRTLYYKDEILYIEIRYFYDIIKLGYFYIGNEIVLVYKIPIAFPTKYDLYKLSLVPNKNHQILVPKLPYIAISGLDSMYMEAECPKANEWYLCDQTTDYKVNADPDCIHQLITKQDILPTCKLTTVTLMRDAVEQLDDKHYTVSFPNDTKVKTSCGQEQYRILRGSYLAVIPLDCYLKTAIFTISNLDDKIKGHPLKIMELPALPQARTPYPTAILNSIDLKSLHAINEKLSLQQAITLEDIPDKSLYHTTIPVYIILCIAAALAVFFGHRSLRNQCARQTITEAKNISIPEGTYCEISETRRRHPHEIKVNHNDISATLSKSISK